MRSKVDTRRLALRRAVPTDIEPYCEKIYCDPAVMEMLPGRVALSMSAAVPRACANLLGSWEADGFGPWIVRLQDSEEILGHCGLRRWPESEDVEVLYALTPQAWGHGYASEAAAASVEEGFSTLGVERIIAGVVAENTASIAVLARLGMTFWKAEDFRDLHVHLYALHRDRAISA